MRSRCTANRSRSRNSSQESKLDPLVHDIEPVQENSQLLTPQTEYPTAGSVDLGTEPMEETPEIKSAAKESATDRHLQKRRLLN
jgi:hypothetical protein